jgi:hypothetical protein
LQWKYQTEGVDPKKEVKEKLGFQKRARVGFLGRSMPFTDTDLLDCKWREPRTALDRKCMAPKQNPATLAHSWASSKVYHDNIDSAGSVCLNGKGGVGLFIIVNRTNNSFSQHDDSNGGENLR